MKLFWFFRKRLFQEMQHAEAFIQSFSHPVPGVVGLNNKFMNQNPVHERTYLLERKRYDLIHVPEVRREKGRLCRGPVQGERKFIVPLPVFLARKFKGVLYINQRRFIGCRTDRLP